MTQRSTKQYTFDTDKLLVMGGCTALLVLFALYVYFVSASVLHVVMREEVERRTSELHSEISRLEADYIRAQHSVSQDIATLQGYVSAEEKIFIGRSSVTAVALSETNVE